MRQNAPEMDRFVTTGVTNFLFKPQNANFGSDLVARNIQVNIDAKNANRRNVLVALIFGMLFNVARKRPRIAKL
jgi:hypothetical protein